MKDIQELGISPWPWKIKHDEAQGTRTNIVDADGRIVFCYDKDVINLETPKNALVMAASPLLYDALFDIMRIEISGTWDDQGAVHAAFAKAELALMKASGENS